MLRVIDLSCSRNESVLFSHLNFAVAPGASMLIYGRNGIGKTTLLKCLAGALESDAGVIEYRGNKLYLGHKHNFHTTLSPIQNLKFLHTINQAYDDLNSELQTNNFESALDYVGLSKDKNVPCCELSAGQLQRINLARLYMTKAKLWLLDEPLINLDLSAQYLFMDLWQRHLGKGGICLLATHNDLSLPLQANDNLLLEDYASRN